MQRVGARAYVVSNDHNAVVEHTRQVAGGVAGVMQTLSASAEHCTRQVNGKTITIIHRKACFSTSSTRARVRCCAFIMDTSGGKLDARHHIAETDTALHAHHLS